MEEHYAIYVVHNLKIMSEHYCFLKFKVLMRSLLYSILAFITVSLSSCELVGDIFKAGVWVGVLIVVAIIGLIIYLISRASGKK